MSILASTESPKHVVEIKSGDELEGYVDVEKTDNLDENSISGTCAEDKLEGPEVSCEDLTVSEDSGDTKDEYGVEIKPLASFGTFEIDPKVRDFKWIQDHTSGKVHQDMPTISMLYNQNLTLPDGARKFIAQSPKLEEEARWEKLKAVFYSFYPEEIQEKAYQSLSELSVLEASRFIATKTSRYEFEVILEPWDSKICEMEIAEDLNKALKSMIASQEKEIIGLGSQLAK